MSQRLRRFFFRRQFYVQLPRIIAARLLERDRRPAVFVSMMGGVGDLVNLFPSVEWLSERWAVDMGTGPPPYATLVRHNPHVQGVHTPFVYKPIRRAHRRLIERSLGAVYDRVILLDEPDGQWRTRTVHMSAVYADRCGGPPPAHGKIYLTDDHRRRAAAYLERSGLKRFVYAVQLVRRSRPFRSWPLDHYHELHRQLHADLGLPIVVDTVGSDETVVGDGCRPLDRVDILTAAALIEQATLYVGPDTGLTHVAAALGVPTVSIHIGYPPAVCRALGDNVILVVPHRPVDDPSLTTPAMVRAAISAHR